MQKQVNVNCISSVDVWGEMVNLHNHDDSLTPKILVAKNIKLEQVLRIINHQPLPVAVMVENGSFASHPSVLLNSKGIQLIVIDSIPENCQHCFAFVSGRTEKAFFDKSMTVIKGKYESYQKNIPEYVPMPEKVKYHGDPIRVNVDGKNQTDLEKGIKMGASGVGILRTEWLGWENSEPPSVDEHYQLYADCVRVLKGKRLNIRLFDIGGDKIPNWAIKVKDEIKSPLGLRGIRSSQILKQAFDNQLKAVAKLSKEAKIGIVLPMISYPEEICNFKKYFGEIDGKYFNNIIWGSMVETPSSALLIREFYKYADFVRIGPGDLSQFTLATLRENIHPGDLSGDTINPAVLKLIKMVMRESKKQGKEANMCLDVEPRKTLLKKLLTAGVRTFNVSPLNIPIVFSLISGLK